MQSHKPVVVLSSGGMDSATALALAIEEQKPKGQVLMLSMYYGQKHVQEIYAASELYEHYCGKLSKRNTGVSLIGHEILDISSIGIFEGSTSALLDPKYAPPEISYDELPEGPSPTEVPFRNAILLSIAIARAIVHKAGSVYVGVHANDYYRWAYPDCSPEFMGAFASATWVGTDSRVRLRFPFIWKPKSEIVMLGTSLDVPYELTFSCYIGKEKHCGRCSTCLERQNAFVYACVPDPTEYLQEVPSATP